MIFNIITSVFIGFIVIGFFLGFWRGWKKSVTRLASNIGAILLAVFLAPVISSALVDKFVTGTVFSGFGLTVDFKEIATEMMGSDGFVADLLTADGTTTEVAKSLMKVVLNLVSFFAIFFVVSFISLLVYWIVCICLRVKRKKRNIVIEKDKKYWWLKVLGGGIGFVGSLALICILLSPVFGVMKICDSFIEEDKTATAAAYNPSSYVCGELYYTDNSEIGGIEGFIEQYAKVKKQYDKSFVGGFLKYTGINAIGNATFNHLTNVGSGDLDVNFTKELVAIIKTYNVYKKTFVINKFDITNNASLDGVMQIYDMAKTSKIVTSYIQEFVPKFCERWINGEKFLGIELPIKGQFQTLVKDVLEVFNTSDLNRIDRNLDAVIGTIKVANNNELIKKLQDGTNFMDFMKENDTFVKQEVIQLSSTPELKNNFPKIINDFTAIAYKEIIGTEGEFESNALTSEQIAAINWGTEADILQNLSGSVLDVYDGVKDASDSSAMINQLTNIGKIIDYARESTLINKPFKIFIEGFITSDLFKLDENVKTTIKESLMDNWSNVDYSYEEMFSVIQETAIVAQNISSAVSSGNVGLDDLSGALGLIVENETIKETVKEIIKSDAVTQMVGDSDSAKAVTDMLEKFVDNSTKESIDTDIAAGQEIVNIIQGTQSEDGIVLSGETPEEKTENAEKIIETIAASENVMGLVKDANEKTAEESGLKNITSDLKGEDAATLIGAIDSADIDDADKLALKALLGIKG